MGRNLDQLRDSPNDPVPEALNALLDQCVEPCLATEGLSLLDNAEELVERARVHQQAGRYAAAEEVAHAAACMVAGSLTESDRARRLFSRAWVIQAELKRQLGSYADAESAFRQVIIVAESWFSSEGLYVAQCRNGLGIVLRYTGRDDEAEQNYRQALQTFDSGGHVSYAATTLHNLAGLYFAQGKLIEAEVAIRHAMDLRLTQSVFPTIAMASDRLCLGGILSTAGKSEAREHVEAALRVYRDKFGPSHIEVGYCLHVLAHIAVAIDGNRQEARVLFTEGLRIKKLHLGASHPELLPTLLSLRHLSEGSERSSLLREALQISNPLPETHPLRKRCLELALAEEIA